MGRIPNQRFGQYNNWEDLRFPAQGINPQGGGTRAPSVESDTGMLLFDPDRQEIAAGVAQMPHSWKEGSTIHPHIHWEPTTGDAGNVLWRFEYEIFGSGTSFTGVYTAIDSVIAADGYKISDLTELDMAGAQVSDMLMWKVSRVGADALDTYAEDVRLFEFDIHYLKDALGSEQEYIKYTVGE